MKRKPFQPDTPADLLKQIYRRLLSCRLPMGIRIERRRFDGAVHGTVLSQRLEKRIGHAWCERGEVVMDLAMPVGIRKFKRAKYYKTLEPEVSKRYSGDHARFLFLRNRHYGPWEESDTTT